MVEKVVYSFLHGGLLTLLTALYVATPCQADEVVAPDYRMGAHSRGNLQLTMDNTGWLARPNWVVGVTVFVDPITGDSVYSCVYPRNSHLTYLSAYLSVGAIVGNDTLVSEVHEMAPDVFPFGAFNARSIDISEPHYDPQARSELDLACTYYDTLVWHLTDYPTGWDMRDHIPLGLKMTQTSMGWSGAAIDDFVIINFELENILRKHLEQVYVGILCFAAVRHVNVDPLADMDNLAGFHHRYLEADLCSYQDTLNLAYFIDNDGDPSEGRFTTRSPKGAVGVALLGSSQDTPTVNFNWWTGLNTLTDSWGPRRKGSVDDPFKEIGPFLGQPYKDANLYYVMAHPEVDYDQIYSATDMQVRGWLQPPHLRKAIAAGLDPSSLLSFGPFELRWRDQVSFTIAVVGGDNVHTDPTFTLDPVHPQYYYDQLDFSELATNARWAQWVYDNPGYDTDSDGYAGEFRICEGDTIWYKGDGVPDFRGNTPPPAPFTRFITEPGRIIVRWNGYLCETFKDPFSGLIDFEGYRVYSGLDTRRASLSILSSHDKENFYRLKYHELGVGQGKWINDEPPYSLDSLRIIHNDPDFDPLRYDRNRPLIEGDSVFRFEPVDANLADLSSRRGIHKVYPDATDPGTDSTLWTEDDITLDYGRPLPKYYEYEFIHENLLPTIPYFVSVTAFDFGYAGGRGNLPPQETNPLNNITECYAQTSADSVEVYHLDVYVYPNPYRVDADYHRRGYENRAGRIIPDRARLLHFGNLPNVCKISLFSLDGDLIGTIDHNFPEGGPEAMHDWWNLVSRSGLAVESGLYYWVVESATRTQIGKFVILK